MHGSSTAGSRMTMHNSHAGKVAGNMCLAPGGTYLPVHANESSGSGSSQLVGGAPPVPEAQEGVMEQEMPRVNAARLHR